jgi:hypothetical protein
MKKLLCIIASVLSLVVSCWGGEEGVWGGKWDDTWPVFLKIEPGTDPGTYKVGYLWLENSQDKDFSRNVTVAKKVGGYFDAGLLIFKLDDTTGTLYGAFEKPRMANLVKLDTGLPDPPDSNNALKKSGWKAAPISAAEAYKSITGKFPGNMANAEEDARNKATDKEHMTQIWKAIMEYKKAKGALPDYLSDLVPEFLPDKDVLISPTVPSGLRRKGDPRLQVSYSYEFRADLMSGGKRTFREAKEEQMEKFGEAVPILRCFAHGKVMNLTYSGDYFESNLFWEVSPAAQELARKLNGGQ